MRFTGHFRPKDPNWTRTDTGNWARPVGENHILLDSTLVPPSLKDKNPYKTGEGLFCPSPSSSGSCFLSRNKDFACLLPVCLPSSSFGYEHKSPDSATIFPKMDKAPCSSSFINTEMLVREVSHSFILSEQEREIILDVILLEIR